MLENADREVTGTAFTNSRPCSNHVKPVKLLPSCPNKTGFKQILENTDVKCIKTENLIGKMRQRYSVVKVLLQVELSAQTKSEEVSEDQKEGGWEGGGGGSGLWTLSSPLTNMPLCLIIKCLLSCPARQSHGPPKI